MKAASLTPHTIAQKLPNIDIVVKIESVKHNVEIPAGRFDLPAEIKALMTDKKTDEKKPREEPSRSRPSTSCYGRAACGTAGTRPVRRAGPSECRPRPGPRRPARRKRCPRHPGGPRKYPRPRVWPPRSRRPVKSPGVEGHHARFQIRQQLFERGGAICFRHDLQGWASAPAPSSESGASINHDRVQHVGLGEGGGQIGGRDVLRVHVDADFAVRQSQRLLEGRRPSCRQTAG
jgi:hypothetical protein